VHPFVTPPAEMAVVKNRKKKRYKKRGRREGEGEGGEKKWLQEFHFGSYSG